MKRWFQPDDMAALIEYARLIGKSSKTARQRVAAQRERWLNNEQFDADRAREDREWCK
jgi:hypothetical protein